VLLKITVYKKGDEGREEKKEMKMTDM